MSRVPRSAPEEAMSNKVAGIDVHKRMLMVAVSEAGAAEGDFECRRFGSTVMELRHLAAWLRERSVQDAVMESTAQYWRPVWLELEPHLRLHLAQAKSNRAPNGRKSDFGDSRRLVRRFVAGELILSYVPEPVQRSWRSLTRNRQQLIRDKVRLQNQIECLLEDARIKLSSVITDLLGVSGRRILRAIAAGESNAEKLAELGDGRLKCTREQLRDAVNGNPEPIHCRLLDLYLERLDVLDRQIETLNQLIAESLRAHQEAVVRLAEVPGLGVESAQQIIAEVGVDARTFDSSAQMASWGGFCPGREESAGENHNSRCPKGNKYLRRVLCQGAQAAVKKKGSHLQLVFKRLLPRLGYKQALWAIARRVCVLVWKILHDGVRYIEFGDAPSPVAAKQRAQKMVRALRRLGYTVEIRPTEPAPAAG
jgi:transposase